MTDYFDTSILSTIIDSVGREHGRLPYVPTVSDFNTRQDAVDQIMAISKHEQTDPSDVARTSYTNYLKFKSTWLHNAGYPLGAWAKRVGYYYRPPKPIKDDSKEPERRSVYSKDTATFDKKDQLERKRYEREQAGSHGVPSFIGDVIKELRKKELKNQ